MKTWNYTLRDMAFSFLKYFFGQLLFSKCQSQTMVDRMKEHIIEVHQWNKNKVPYHNRIVRINVKNPLQSQGPCRSQSWMRRLWWLILSSVNLAEPKDTHVENKTRLTGVSARAFPEELSICMSRLREGSTLTSSNKHHPDRQRPGQTPRSVLVQMLSP